MAGQGNARGAGDAELHAAVGKAVRAALAGLGTGPTNQGAQTLLAQRTGITQPEISKIVRGARPTPLTIWEMREIEQATNRPAGFILRHMGYLPDSSATDVRAVIQGSPELDEDARRMLLAAYDAAVPPKAATTKKRAAKS